MKDGMLKGADVAKVMDDSGKHTEHGRDGSHQNTHKQVGGARSRIVTGHPDEMQSGDGRKE